MSNIILSRSIRNSRTGFFPFPRLYPAICTSRAASLNSSIHRGLRRSKGVGFRGKERSPTQDGVHNHGGSDGSVRRIIESGSPAASGSQMTRGQWKRKSTSSPPGPASALKPSRGKAPTLDSETQKPWPSIPSPRPWGGKTFSPDSKTPNTRPSRPLRISRGKLRLEEPESEKPRKLTRKARFYDPDSSFGKKSLARRRTTAEEAPVAEKGSFARGGTFFQRGRDTRSNPGPSREAGQSALGRRDGEGYNREESGFRARNQREEYPSLSSRRSTYESSSRENNSREAHSSNRKSATRFPSTSQGNSFRSGENYPLPRFGSMNTKSEEPSGGPPPTRTVDNRVPLSIPYTTPASEFLYGTSVVEAALSSRKVPRRKLYKLYIFNGENREQSNVERDAGLERLARKNGAEVVRVKAEWSRLLDKMSGGRPHNGYILEASPLPRLPITSLGEITTEHDQQGFAVTLDHQSREEAAVNGTSNFIRIHKNRGRNPLVLFLDGILDPGNLGGIIRTASFLGVTAVAVSTRHCAPFSPVVLKASAGASENVTVFSVNKPAGFIVDSKQAGWKVFAAVAPPTSEWRDPDLPKAMTTDDLKDPLYEDPCILMLGGEGEGLRWNLRRKADVDLSVKGSGHSFNVDSLNVSVAAGILCTSFLRQNNVEKTSSLGEHESKVGCSDPPTSDLF